MLPTTNTSTHRVTGALPTEIRESESEIHIQLGNMPSHSAIDFSDTAQNWHNRSSVVGSNADRSGDICLHAIVGSLLTAASAGFAYLFSMSVMGLHHRGPMNINRDCSMVNATATAGSEASVSESGLHNQTSAIELCKNDENMRILAACVILISTVGTLVCTTMAIYNCGKSVLKLESQLRGRPVKPKPDLRPTVDQGPFTMEELQRRNENKYDYAGAG